MIEGIITLTAGMIAASGLVISKQSNAQQIMTKIGPVQGLLGILLGCWGVWQVYKCMQVIQLLSVPVLRSHWIFWTTCNVIDILIGIFLAFGITNKSNGRVNGTMKVLKYQVPLGFFAICMGIAFLILYREF